MAAPGARVRIFLKALSSLILNGISPSCSSTGTSLRITAEANICRIASSICRIGRANPNVIAEMKAQALRDLDSPAPDDDSKSALLVTLLKLGEDGFIRDNKARLLSGSKDNFESWLAEVLSGVGATETGPNNCMTKDWNGRRVTKPSLQWANGRWFVRS